MFLHHATLKQAAALTAQLRQPHDPIFDIGAWGQLYRTILTVERIRGVFRQSTDTPVVVLRAPGRHGMVVPFLPAPDYFDPSRYCLMTPFDTQLGFNSLVKSAFADTYTEEVAQIPYIHRSDLEAYLPTQAAPDVNVLWRKYLKEQVKHNYISHFFGEKSQRIRWSVERYARDCEDGQLVQEHIDHSLRVADKSGEQLHAYSIAALAVTDGAFDVFDIGLNYVYAVKAYDTVTQETVCLMNVTLESNGVVCKRIAVSHAEQYKPYSLVAMANLWAIRFFLYSTSAFYLDLGTNFNTSGGYKDSFKHRTEPLYNFPAQNSLYALGQWLNERSKYTVTATTWSSVGYSEAIPT